MEEFWEGGLVRCFFRAVRGLVRWSFRGVGVLLLVPFLFVLCYDRFSVIGATFGSGLAQSTLCIYFI